MRAALRKALTAWSGVELAQALAGGARSQVFLAHRHGQELVVRCSTRSAASLEWELDLLEHLTGHDIFVPELVPADDGRRHVEGLLVQQFIRGRQPRDSHDWRLVVDVLGTIHELTRGWPQRPGFASARALLAADRGGDVRLDRMPPAAVHAVRRAWQPILQGSECAIHADVGAGNILIDGDRVALLDWDEARVDVPWFDFAFVPLGVEVPSPTDRATLETAGVAWEAATCWVVEPAYAARRLAELVARLDRGPGIETAARRGVGALAQPT
jgi:Ser/Thr protein kinase RdoA (MazF antagonist)